MRYSRKIINFAPMKIHSFFSLTVIFLSLAVSCTNPYKDLDYAIAHADEYDKAYQQRQDSLYSEFVSQREDSIKFESAYLLQKEYFYHNADSCRKYSRIMLDLSSGSLKRQTLSNICLSRILSRMDSLEKAEYFLKKISVDDIPKEYLSMYYFSKYSLIKRLYPSDSTAMKRIQNEWWQADSTNVECIYVCGRNAIDSDKKRRIAESLENIISTTSSLNEYAKANYGLGVLYLRSGEEKKAIKYLVESAKTDMQLSVKGYDALCNLSRILMRTGDVKRAVRYIRQTRKDSHTYNYFSRFMAINEIEVETLNALLVQESNRKRVLFIITPVIAILLMLTLLFLIKLSTSKRKLSEVSSIKDGFLTTYMERCVDYLGKVDQYRSYLRHTAKHEGQDAVLAILRKPSFADYEFHKLLADFDAAFLGIFPDFIDKVNGIMQPQYMFPQTGEKELNTNLRILALIRMGISDRKKIAKILNMSVNTVYTYHTYLQQHSICSSKEFDRKVKKL